MSVPKRLRTSNYTLEDSFKLMDIVVQFKNVIENKSTDAVTSQEKTNAWGKMAAMYNAHTTEHRSADQLKQKYDSLKKNARKYSAADRRQQVLQTGGGPPPSMKTNRLFEKVLELIKLSSEGHKSIYDSDALGAACCSTPAEGYSSDELENEAGTPNGSIVHVELVNDFDESNSCCDAVSGLPGSSLWRKYTPSMLQMPPHFTNEVLNGKDTNISSQLPVATSVSDPMPTLEYNLTPMQRRRPAVRKKNPTMSLSGRKLEPWVKAKTQLCGETLLHQQKRNKREEENEIELHKIKIKEAELRIEYLRKKYEEEQRRDQEIHEIKKKDLLLSIKIKEETLRRMNMS